MCGAGETSHAVHGGWENGARQDLVLGVGVGVGVGVSVGGS